MLKDEDEEYRESKSHTKKLGYDGESSEMDNDKETNDFKIDQIIEKYNHENTKSNLYFSKPVCKNFKRT